MEGKKIFLVSFLGRDEAGPIIKGIEVLSDTRENALALAQELSNSSRIYSAIEV